MARPKTDPRNVKPRSGKTVPELGDHQCFHCGTPLTRCSECKKLWAARTTKAITCSDICRQNRYWRLKKEMEAS